MLDVSGIYSQAYIQLFFVISRLSRISIMSRLSRISRISILSRISRMSRISRISTLSLRKAIMHIKQNKNPASNHTCRIIIFISLSETISIIDTY